MNVILKSFWELSIKNGRSFLSHHVDKRYDRAMNIISIFYFLLFVFSVQTFSPFAMFPEWDLLLRSEHLFLPIWSVKWLHYLDWEYAVRGVLLFYFFASMVGMLFFQKSKLVRVLVFLSLFLYVSFISSFGKIDHFMHLVLIASFLLIFLPSARHLSRKVETLKVVFGIQAFMFLGYFSSGFFKIAGTIKQLLGGSLSVFSDESLGINLSKTMMAFDLNYFFTEYILNHSTYFFSFMLLVGYFVELLAVYIIFKNHLHRIWGFLLIVLHAVILLTVGADFTTQIVVVGLFIMFSPFTEASGDLSGDVRFILKQIKNRFVVEEPKELIVFYDGDCITCNKFLMKMSKFDLPDNLVISAQSEDYFKKIINQYSDLTTVDSVVVLEKFENCEKVKIKADAITYLLYKLSKKQVFLRFAYLLSPFVANLTYDVVAILRSKTDENSCLVPPSNLRKKIRLL